MLKQSVEIEFQMNQLRRLSATKDLIDEIRCTSPFKFP